MLIEVTTEHILLGAMESDCDCPIALAIKGKGAKYVSVGTVHVLVGNAFSDSISTRLPSTAQEFIYRFDGYEPVEPFTFELDLKSEATSDQA